MKVTGFLVSLLRYNFLKTHRRGPIIFLQSSDSYIRNVNLWSSTESCLQRVLQKLRCIIERWRVREQQISELNLFSQAHLISSIVFAYICL